MIVVTLLAVMLGIAAPSFRDFMAGQRVKTAAGEYATALVQARSEAIKRNAAVTVTQAAAGWQGGWTVATATVATLSSQQEYSGLAFSCRLAGAVVACPAVITYLGTGRLSAGVAKMQVTSTVDTSARSCVAIDLSGMPVSTKGACT